MPRRSSHTTSCPSGCSAELCCRDAVAVRAQLPPAPWPDDWPFSQGQNWRAGLRVEIGVELYRAQCDVQAGDGHQAGHPRGVLPVDQECVWLVDEWLLPVWREGTGCGGGAGAQGVSAQVWSCRAAPFPPGSQGWGCSHRCQPPLEDPGPCPWLLSTLGGGCWALSPLTNT